MWLFDLSQNNKNTVIIFLLLFCVHLGVKVFWIFAPNAMCSFLTRFSDFKAKYLETLTCVCAWVCWKGMRTWSRWLLSSVLPQMFIFWLKGNTSDCLSVFFCLFFLFLYIFLLWENQVTSQIFKMFSIIDLWWYCVGKVPSCHTDELTVTKMARFLT